MGFNENQKKPVFWIIAGTAEGRKLADILSDYNAYIYVSLATEYGRSLIREKDNLTVLSGRLDQDEMISFIQEKKVTCVVDTTHPYAREVTKNIASACSLTQTPYLRLLREQSPLTDFVCARDSKQAAEMLKEIPGRIFLTCGSKEAEVFTSIPVFSDRITIRVLPIPDVIQKCLDLGFKPSNIIGMQGPFSKELNTAMFKAAGAEILVTKDSGAEGGFMEKIEAALELGIKVVVIGRPLEDTGYPFQQVIDKLIADYKLELKNQKGKEEL